MMATGTDRGERQMQFPGSQEGGYSRQARRNFDSYEGLEWTCQTDDGILNPTPKVLTCVLIRTGRAENTLCGEPWGGSSSATTSEWDNRI